MLRYRPTTITLSVDDVDLACQRLGQRASTTIAQNNLASIPRVRGGAQRSLEDAYTSSGTEAEFSCPRAGLVLDQKRCRALSDAAQRLSSDSTVTCWPEDHVQAAELSPPRYRKDLTKLGVPLSTFDPTSMLARQTAMGMTLDGAGEARDTLRASRTDRSPNLARNDQSRQTAVAPMLRTQGPADNRPPNHRSSELVVARNWRKCITTSLVVHTVHPDPHLATSDASPHPNLNTPHQDPPGLPAGHIRPSTLEAREDTHRIPFSVGSAHVHSQTAAAFRALVLPGNMMSSVSTPNLVSRAVSSEILHSRRASASATSPRPVLVKGVPPTSDLKTKRVTSGPNQPPILEIIGDYVSPLEDLEHRFEAMSDRSGSLSSSSFYTADNQSHTRSQIRFPSFDSPEKPFPPPLVLTANDSPSELSTGSSRLHRKAVPTRVLPEPQSPTRIRSIALPPPQHKDPIASSHDPARHARHFNNKDHKDSEVQVSRSRNDSAVDVNDLQSSSSAGVPEHQDGKLLSRSTSRGLRALPKEIPTEVATSSASRMIREQVPEALGTDRNSNSTPILARRSMPTPRQPASQHSDTSRTGHRSSRPSSYGARPRTYIHQRPFHSGANAIYQRDGDRLPPRPPPSVNLPVRPKTNRLSNQENDGSAEEEMMREELRQMRLRGGQDTRQPSAVATTAIVLDETPPREGRLERLMRS